MLSIFKQPNIHKVVSSEKNKFIISLDDSKSLRGLVSILFWRVAINQTFLIDYDGTLLKSKKLLCILSTNSYNKLIKFKN